MKRKGWNAIIVGTAFLLAGLAVRAEEPYKVVNSGRNFYFGHISYIEPGAEEGAPLILKEGRGAPEPVLLNLPVRPGDTVRTLSGRRCEIQFDTGTVVRLDHDTEIKIETILARSLSSLQELSNLDLVSGRVYVMYKEFNRREMFQVLTANAAVKMRHNSVVIIRAPADGSTEVQVALGRARVLFGEDVKRLREQEVRKEERFVVQRDHQSQMAAFIPGTDFELWNRDINKRFEELHEGLTPLPKPVQKMSSAVFYFAQHYGSRYGEWLWDDFLGYVWKPFIDNAMYPWGWQPYYYGRWISEGGGMFWVPQEPWGWIPYHLGIWHWDKKKGWVWLPGSLFAPAWVDWSFYFGYAAWRPWGLWDWGGYGSSGFFYVENRWSYDGPVPSRTITKDQLKEPAAPPYPVPKELRSVIKKVQGALSKGDPRLVESARDIPRHLVLVRKEELGARRVHEKARSWEDIPKLSGVPPATSGPGAFRRFADPAAEAVRLLRGTETPRSLPLRRGTPEIPSAEAPSATGVAGPRGRPAAALFRGENPADKAGEASPAPGPVARFRDWNPDLGLAREMGVRIEYSSRRNEVICPELKLSSRDRSRTTSLRDAYDSGYTMSGGSSSGSSGSAGSSSSTGQSSRSSSGEKGAQRSSSKSGESGKIKK